MRVYSKLLPFEAWRLEEHLLRLEPADRLMRFSGGVSAEIIARHCRELNWMRAVVIGCFEEGVLRGAAELWLDTPTGGAAELAISVEHGWQDRGIGTQLFGRALTLARNRGAASLTMICLIDNPRMQHIAQKFGSTLAPLGDQAEAQLAVRPLTEVSLWEEFLTDGLGLTLRFLGEAAALLAPPRGAAAGLPQV